MGIQEKIVPEIKPFDAYAAFEREREHSKLMERRLLRALELLRCECSRRELAGEDRSHIRAFIREASQ